MNQQIKVGDTVYVAQPLPCCGYAGSMYKQFTVPKIFTNWWYCQRCGKLHPPALLALYPDGAGSVVAVWRLRKLDGTPIQAARTTTKRIPIPA